MARWIRTYWDDYCDEEGTRQHVCIYTRVEKVENSDEKPRRVGGRAADARGAHERADAHARAAISRYDTSPMIVSSRERAADDV